MRTHGVLHRDLKPGNVFLTEDGRVKLLDFGLAHLLGTRGVQGAGTPAYMAPEQLRGEAVDARADVFALGATLFETLTGNAPFEVKEGRSAALDARVPPPPKGTAAPLAKLLERCLSPDPARRPASGQAMVEELLAVQQALDRRDSANRPVPAGIPASRRRLRRAVLLAGIAVLLAGSIYLATRVRFTTEPPAARDASAALPSVAVLPFTDLSPGKDQEYFADGVAEEVLNALAQVEDLHVAGRTSSFSFKGRHATIEEIGRTLHVDAVLEGSVHKEGHRIRVAAQIVSARDGYRLWAQSFDRELTDVFAVQDEIAEAVVAALRVKLLPGKTPTTRAVRTGNAEVYRLYLLGRDLAKRGTLEQWKRALSVYEQALALDPRYAPAWAGVAFDLLKIEGTGWEGGGTPSERRTRALEAADRAIALAPDQPDGYWVRATIRMSFAYDWKGAEADLDRARALSPSDVDAATESGHLLAILGRFPEALQVARRATELDPLSAAAWDRLGFAYTYANEPERGREALHRSLDVVPEGPGATLFLIMNRVSAGQPAEALAAAQRSTFEWIRSFGEALALRDLGRPGEARAALERLIADESWYQIAEVFAWQGEPDRAFEWLERAYANRDPGLTMARGDPLLRSLHGDARWKPLLRRLNLPTE